MKKLKILKKQPFYICSWRCSNKQRQ